MVGSEVFHMKPKHQFIYPNDENGLMVLHHEKRRLLREFVFTPVDKQTDSKKDGKKVFLMKSKHQYHLSQ